MANPFLSVVIPAFNEEARIVPTLERVAAYLGAQPYTWEVVVADDGSADRTAALVRQFAQMHEGVRVETLPHAGKGWAVKHGMLAAMGEYRLMCDADLATPIELVDGFLKRMAEGYDIVIGSRQVAGARRFDEPPIRHILGRFFNWTVRLLAVRAFQDTQCGFKCFRAEAADALFGLQRTRGFGFDVEILYLALKRRLRVVEMPIDWQHKQSSKVRAGIDSFLMLRDTMLVRLYDLQGKYKNMSPPVVADTQNVSETLPQPDPKDGLVAVVVPTYNEAANLPDLAKRVFALGIPNARLIIVDDNSPDGTANVAEELSRQFDGRIHLIKRAGKQGLGTAYIAGFSQALADGADYVVQMDADLSHAPEYIPGMLETLTRSDVAVGSRYTRGGGVDENWGFRRRFLSSFANKGIRLAAGLKVKDATSGFKVYRGSVLRALNLTRFQCKGFGFQAEVAHACQRKGYRVVEFPIKFVDRTKGRSKMSMFIIFEAFWRLLLLRWKR